MGADGGSGMEADGGAATLQADAFKRLYPDQYFQRFVEQGIRPDGRTLTLCRAASIGVHSVAQADGSALVKLGSTSVLAGVRLEVAVPPAARPDVGVLAVSVEATPLSSPDWRPGRRSGAADVLAATIAGILTGDARGDGASAGNWAPVGPTGEPGGVLDLRQLCIAPGQAVWVLYLDIYVLDADGSLLDAGLLAAVAALRDAQLPAVRLTEQGNVERLAGGGSGDAAMQDGDASEPAASHPLALAYTPTCVTCGLYGDHILADPTAEEEALLGASVSVVLDEAGGLAALFKHGGSRTAPPATLKRCMELAAGRAQELRAQLERGEGGTQ